MSLNFIGWPVFWDGRRTILESDGFIINVTWLKTSCTNIKYGKKITIKYKDQILYSISYTYDDSVLSTTKIK